ncbi:hypothetical protein ABT246_17700 [Streptomyces sp. NPDC001553]|uniref:hypothetical protein n=1 Tax=Streptomyces sp. NPDC001553 TaxID=3154385 RepID=UPI00331F6891
MSVLWEVHVQEEEDEDELKAMRRDALRCDAFEPGAWLSGHAPLRTSARHRSVTKIVPFGVSVRIEDREDGFEGLVHTSELDQSSEDGWRSVVGTRLCEPMSGVVARVHGHGLR